MVVAAHLRGRGVVRRYLDAINDLDSGDGSLIRAALNDIDKADSVTRLSREPRLSRVGIYKAFAPDRSWRYDQWIREIHAHG